jgi:hypothetical protein
MQRKELMRLYIYPAEDAGPFSKKRFGIEKTRF